jgi:hypothetical protein
MAFEELKERHAMVWGSAPFENCVQGLADIHEHLVRELQPQPGERWLDIGVTDAPGEYLIILGRRK